MVVVEGLNWRQFSSLPHIARLPLNRQINEYDAYNQQILAEALARQQYNNANDVHAVGSGKRVVPQDEGLPLGCIEFTANTLDSRYFEVRVGTSTETTYTADWGDGTTGEGTLLAEDTTTISHEYANDSQEYIIRLCFADASAVTSLEFEGND